MSTSTANLSLLTLLAGCSWLLSLIPSQEFKTFPQLADQKLKNTDGGKPQKILTGEATTLLFARKGGGVRWAMRARGNSSVKALGRCEDLWVEASSKPQSSHFSLLRDPLGSPSGLH